MIKLFHLISGRILRLVAAILWVALFFVPSSAYASLFPPSCICKIEAKVLFIKEAPIPKSEFQLQDLVSVDLEIEILKIMATVNPGISPEIKCENLYKKGQSFKVQVIKERDFVDRNQIIKTESVIQGNIEASGDEHGAWFNFYKIQLAGANK